MHAKQVFHNQILQEPSQMTAQQRKKISLQLSSGGKTHKTQTSSAKPGTILGDLKTPDKCVFDFNSLVSGNKTLEKSSHEKKFHINSSSVEKFRI